MGSPSEGGAEPRQEQGLRAARAPRPACSPAGERPLPGAGRENAFIMSAVSVLESAGGLCAAGTCLLEPERPGQIPAVSPVGGGDRRNPGKTPVSQLKIMALF